MISQRLESKTSHSVLPEFAEFLGAHQELPSERFPYSREIAEQLLADLEEICGEPTEAHAESKPLSWIGNLPVSYLVGGGFQGEISSPIFKGTIAVTYGERRGVLSKNDEGAITLELEGDLIGLDYEGDVMDLIGNVGAEDRVVDHIKMGLTVMESDVAPGQPPTAKLRQFADFVTILKLSLQSDR